MTERFRVTYATLSADNEELHAAYEAGVERVRSWLGTEVAAPGDPRPGAPVRVASPADPSVTVCRVCPASPAAVAQAVSAARAAFPGWAATPWRQRVELLRRCADAVSDAADELAALVSVEVGKNRLEALGDVEEAAVFFRYYGDIMTANDGYDVAMDSLSERERTRSVLKPYGVWGVISPFNFPVALAAGPTAAALLAGNTVLVKPSLQGTASAWRLHEVLTGAGLPEGVLQLVPGGDEVGRALVSAPDVAGLTFTGSYQAGMQILAQGGSAWPRPVITEMGGKNPAVVAASADLDAAAEGVARSAFGYSGQKCSACSRVYVEASVHDDFVARLVRRAESAVVGDPLQRDTFVGPVIGAESVERFRDAVAQARRRGQVVAGGEVLTSEELPGHYVAPTVVTGLAPDDPLLGTELFLPFVTVVPVESVEEGIERANATVFGLTAGFFSGDDAEVEEFLRRVEAGVVYVNRRAGATTGAWPGVQPFGGWKGSGSSGKAGGGIHYLPLYLREQSQTVVTP
ncbi:aldehyde dehydrogenase family protein [Auraticoccus sp. F435]|uniref:L-glutamate gamma-semialdehyde dehydrogenase n=1 Tax=Auraticoccus cholistanensis TaxID=2656650 RepID=A0A6A9UWF7_9ACTN|nr:aldehyde dehydrogenase family protein [Auraticoccus cholistanensis]MVA77061.1 aldehyde dehydrogenase family protein [Auraticoccus cholistanensis]